MKNYDHDKSFLWNLKRDFKKDFTRDSFAGFLYKNHRLLVESLFIGILLLFYFEHIWPMIELIPVQEDPKIALALGGFIFFSLIAFVTFIPYWITSWLFLLIEGLFLLGIKTHKLVRQIKWIWILLREI